MLIWSTINLFISFLYFYSNGQVGLKNKDTSSPLQMPMSALNQQGEVCFCVCKKGNCHTYPHKTFYPPQGHCNGVLTFFIMYWSIKLLIIFYQLFPSINYWLIKLLFISCTSTHPMCIYFSQIKYPTSAPCPHLPSLNREAPLPQS